MYNKSSRARSTPPHMEHHALGLAVGSVYQYLEGKKERSPHFASSSSSNGRRRRRRCLLALCMAALLPVPCTHLAGRPPSREKRSRAAAWVEPYFKFSNTYFGRRRKKSGEGAPSNNRLQRCRLARRNEPPRKTEERRLFFKKNHLPKRQCAVIRTTGISQTGEHSFARRVEEEEKAWLDRIAEQEKKRKIFALV